MSVLKKLSVTALSEGYFVRLMLRRMPLSSACLTKSTFPKIPPRTEWTATFPGLPRASNTLVSAAKLSLATCSVDSRAHEVPCTKVGKSTARNEPGSLSNPTS